MENISNFEKVIKKAKPVFTALLAGTLFFGVQQEISAQENTNELTQKEISFFNDLNKFQESAFTQYASYRGELSRIMTTMNTFSLEGDDAEVLGVIKGSLDKTVILYDEFGGAEGYVEKMKNHIHIFLQSEAGTLFKEQINNLERETGGQIVLNRDGQVEVINLPDPSDDKMVQLLAELEKNPTSTVIQEIISSNEYNTMGKQAVSNMLNVVMQDPSYGADASGPYQIVEALYNPFSPEQIETTLKHWNKIPSWRKQLFSDLLTSGSFYRSLALTDSLVADGYKILGSFHVHPAQGHKFFRAYMPEKIRNALKNLKDQTTLADELGIDAKKANFGPEVVFKATKDSIEYAIITYKGPRVFSTEK